MKNGDVRASLMFPSNKRGSDSVNYPLFLEPKGRMSFFEARPSSLSSDNGVCAQRSNVQFRCARASISACSTRTRWC